LRLIIGRAIAIVVGAVGLLLGSKTPKADSLVQNSNRI
jgi:hypothetical protein